MTTIKVVDPDKKLTVEEMLAGILSAVEIYSGARPESRGNRESEGRVVLAIEVTTSGYLKLTERVTHLEGDEKRTIRDAVESLHTKLATKALEEERHAAQRLLRLGIRT